MLTILTEKRTLGVNFHDECSPTALVWAPHARKLALVAENRQQYSFKRMEYGYWQCACPGLKPGDRYLLQINDKKELPDPASLSQPDGVHLASQCIDLNTIRQIKSESWQGISTAQLIIYEVHVGTFTQQGTFKALTQKLAHLKELGVNAIEIMPVAQFPGHRNWGYDGVFPFATQHSYGGPYELAKMVKACHDHCIAVILDVVYNHLGPEGNYFEEFAPYFTGKYNTPWGKAINFDDAWCDSVRRFFLENALMWFRDFHIDGLRLDAIHAIKDDGPKHFLAELSELVHMLNKKNNSRHFLIAESDLNDTRVISPIQENGYGMDAQWCDEWHHALHALLTGETNGYYSDFGKTSHLAKAMNHGWVHDGIYSQHRKKIYGTPTAGIPGERFVIYTQNHDQTGNRIQGDRLSKLTDFESLKLAATAMLMSPFTPMLFMGEEFAEQNPFLFFISHSDTHLVKKVQRGRKREYRDFMKNGDPPDPQDEETFEKSKLNWNFTGEPQKVQLFNFYKACIALRQSHPLFKQIDRHNTRAIDIKGSEVILFYRQHQGRSMITAMNFSHREQSVSIPGVIPEQWEVLLYSGHEKWGGHTPESEQQVIMQENEIASLALCARSALVMAVKA